jgi:hypothetical protein
LYGGFIGDAPTGDGVIGEDGISDRRGEDRRRREMLLWGRRDVAGGVILGNSEGGGGGEGEGKMNERIRGGGVGVGGNGFSLAYIH